MISSVLIARISILFLLFSNIIMSTSMLVQKMNIAAEKEGYECDIHAYSIAELDSVKDNADIILLGPQIRFKLNSVKEACKGVVVEAINPVDYGTMNGENVLAHVRKVVGD